MKIKLPGKQLYRFIISHKNLKRREGAKTAKEYIEDIKLSNFNVTV